VSKISRRTFFQGAALAVSANRVAGLCDVKQEARERTQALLHQLAPGWAARSSGTPPTGDASTIRKPTS
jgi:hypothetical protein